MRSPPLAIPDYSVDVKNEKLDTPIKDSHGNEVSERTSESRLQGQDPFA